MKYKHGIMVRISEDRLKQLFNIPEDVDIIVMPSYATDGITLKIRTYGPSRTINVLGDTIKLYSIPEGAEYPMQYINKAYE